ncbi:Stage II sporulation protein D [[Clostridium] ultunense Esp]|nr:Stage II sporulation protein D [[Clostridium] ultunense Esp]
MYFERYFTKRTYIGFLFLLFSVSSLIALIFAGSSLRVSNAFPREEAAVPATSSLANGDLHNLTIEVPVYRVGKKVVEKFPLEEYLIGVVAGEMPAEFPLEALKAQAITARTYLIRRIVDRDFADVPGGAFVKDSIDHQVYLGTEELKKAWGKDYEWKTDKIRKAVYETEGLVLTYDGRPITATFFSTSNGRTENAEEYWSEPYPYLKSVPSPWDEKSPEFAQTTRLPLKEVSAKLGITIAGPAEDWSGVLKWTTGGQIASIRIGGKMFTGREVRERLKLPSATFWWEVNGDDLVIKTKGYGHGVGMSQWGASGMAKEGKKAEEILTYYYKGVSLEDYRNWIAEK